MRELKLSPVAVVLSLIFVGAFFLSPRPDMDAEAGLDATTVAKTTILVDGAFRAVVTIYSPSIGGNPLGVDPNAPGQQGSSAFQADCMCLYAGYGNWAGYARSGTTSGTYATFNANEQVIHPTGSHRPFTEVTCHLGDDF